MGLQTVRCSGCDCSMRQGLSLPGLLAFAAYGFGLSFV